MNFQLNLRQKKLAMKAGIVVGVLTVFAFVIVGPKYSAQKKIQDEIKSLTDRSHQIQKIIPRFGHSGKKYRDILNTLSSYRGQIPYRENLPEVIDYVASKAQDDRLDVVSLQPTTSQEFLQADGSPFEDQGRQVRKLMIRMKLKGNYLNLGRYLEDLKGSPYEILIEGVSIKNERVSVKKRESGGDLTIDLALGVLMMFAPQPAAK